MGIVVIGMTEGKIGSAIELWEYCDLLLQQKGEEQLRKELSIKVHAADRSDEAIKCCQEALEVIGVV